jgi:hypothetical protein
MASTTAGTHRHIISSSLIDRSIPQKKKEAIAIAIAIAMGVA